MDLKVLGAPYQGKRRCQGRGVTGVGEGAIGREEEDVGVWEGAALVGMAPARAVHQRKWTVLRNNFTP